MQSTYSYTHTLFFSFMISDTARKTLVIQLHIILHTNNMHYQHCRSEFKSLMHSSEFMGFSWGFLVCFCFYNEVWFNSQTKQCQALFFKQKNIQAFSVGIKTTTLITKQFVERCVHLAVQKATRHFSYKKTLTHPLYTYEVVSQFAEQEQSNKSTTKVLTSLNSRGGG